MNFCSDLLVLVLDLRPAALIHVRDPHLPPVAAAGVEPAGTAHTGRPTLAGCIRRPSRRLRARRGRSGRSASTVTSPSAAAAAEAPSDGVGDRVAAAREHVGLSEDMLAKRLGIKIDTLRKWENDVAEPPTTTMRSVTAGL